MEEESAPVTPQDQPLLQKDHDTPSDEVTPLVSVQEFKRQADLIGSSINWDILNGATREEVCRFMGLDGQQYSEVEHRCSVSLVLPPGGIEPITKIKVSELPTDSLLQSIRSPELSRALLDRRGTGLSALLPTPCTSLLSSAFVQLPEVVLSILIFHPVKKRPNQEWLVLGSQCLTELRDKIICSTDYFIDKDYSENPGACDRTLMETTPPRPSRSAFFFINNMFYNDRRHPLSTDYSKIITDWIEEGQRVELSPRLDNFITADMASTRFDQLSLRLGYPYLFLHHGNCEHLLVARDLRLLHSMDSPSPFDYPRLVFQNRGKSKKCSVCAIFIPTWVTRNDSLAPESPCFFCEDCFYKLHYDKEGRKVCSFEAYPYYIPS